MKTTVCQTMARKVMSRGSAEKKPRAFASAFLFTFVFMVVTFLTACGGVDEAGTSPEIASFEASTETIVKGDSARLTAIFSNGSGSINNGIGAVASGATMTIAPTQTTTYTLTVTNNKLVQTTAKLTVAVEPKLIAQPEITSFEASALTIFEGDSTELTAVYSHGSGSIDNGVGAVASGEPKIVSPEETTTYTLTVTNSEGAEVTSTATVEVAPHPISLSIVEPTHNWLVNGEMNVAVSVESELDIATLTATVGDESVPLVYSAEAVCDEGDCAPGFIGQIPLGELPSGVQLLTVTAVDVEGRSISEERDVRLDNKPVLTIAKPLNLTAVTRYLAVNVACTDDTGDCEITVTVIGAPNRLLASGVGSLLDSLDLSEFDSQEVTLLIEGKDDLGQVTSVSRNILVETSENLERLIDFDGSIVDFDGQRALAYIPGINGDSLSVHDVASNTCTVVEVPLGSTVLSSSSYLTPTGVIYEAGPMNGGRQDVRLYDWNQLTLRDLGLIYHASLDVAGDYAIWGSDGSLWLRRFSTETDVRVGNASRGAVGATGVVVYEPANDRGYIIKYDEGSETTLFEPLENSIFGLDTDGTNLVYGVYSKGEDAIVYYDGSGNSQPAHQRTEALAYFDERNVSPGADYQINNGWAAFTRRDFRGDSTLWTRDPTGTFSQRGDWRTGNYIDTLAHDGEVMLVMSGRRYLSDLTGDLTEVGSTLGTSTKIDGVWYIYIGRSLFRVR